VLAEAVDHDEDAVKAVVGEGQVEEVHCDLLPFPCGYGDGLEEARGCLVGWLGPLADVAGVDVSSDVEREAGPVVRPRDEVGGLGAPQVAGDRVVVTGADEGGAKSAVGGDPQTTGVPVMVQTVWLTCLVRCRGRHELAVFDVAAMKRLQVVGVPLNGDGGGEIWPARQAVSWVGFAWFILNVQAGAKGLDGFEPPSLAAGELMLPLQVLECVMVGVDGNVALLQVRPPFFEGHDECEHLTLVGCPVTLRFREAPGHKGDGLEAVTLVLVQACTDGKVAGVRPYGVVPLGVRDGQNRRLTESLLEAVEGSGRSLGPEERLGCASEISERGCYVPKIADELSIEVTEAQEATNFPEVLRLGPGLNGLYLLGIYPDLSGRNDMS
jgi:hypothetical protein